MASSFDHDNATEQETRRVPPRFWWLKRLTAAGVVLVLAMLGLRLWWGHVADERLQAKIAEYRALGQPVLPEDFRREPIPDEENGAYWLKRAASQVTPPRRPDANSDWPFVTLPVSSEELDRFSEALRINQQVLEMVRTARSRTATDWNINWRTPAISILLHQLFPDVSAQRWLAKLTCAAARYHHQTGDDATSVEMLRDVLGIGRHAESQGPTLNSHLARIAFDSVAERAIKDVAPDLHVSDEPADATGDTCPARRAQVRALVSDLLDERLVHEVWAQCMYAERMFEVDTVLAVTNNRLSLAALAGMVGTGKGVLPGLIWLVEPAWKLDAIRMMEYTTACAEATAAPNWPAAQTLLPPSIRTPDSPVQVASRALSWILCPDLDRTPRTHYKWLAGRRTAAVELAVRLYEIDHGHRPATLADLVPDYLPTVPRDPLDAAGGEVYYPAEIQEPEAEGQ